ncbi:MAG: hypothetical protein OEM26_09230, partial [Saprospiraceae bacterium]|nr:hypothetical protein [Saprospiraceae bacterium]
LIEIVDASAINCNGDCVVTNLNDSGNGSLRNCIDNAQPGDQICFDLTLHNGTIVLNSTLSLDQNLSIQTNKGLNLHIDGSSVVNSLHVPIGSSITLEGIRIMGANGTNGVVYNQGNLTMVNCQIYGDQGAGAIFVNEGELNLENSTGIYLENE